MTNYQQFSSIDFYAKRLCKIFFANQTKITIFCSFYDAWVWRTYPDMNLWVDANDKLIKLKEIMLLFPKIQSISIYHLCLCDNTMESILHEIQNQKRYKNVWLRIHEIDEKGFELQAENVQYIHGGKMWITGI
eukprot:373319_1